MAKRWINTGVNTQLKRRKKRRLCRNARRSRTDKAWAEFKRERRPVESGVRRRHGEYILTIGASQDTNNTKPFWNYVK